MATTPSYNLRSRLQRPSLSLQASPTHSVHKLYTSVDRRQQNRTAYLDIEQVIGATITNPCGLSACVANRTFAYCAGSVAILARIHDDESISKRYFKARPTVNSINPATSHYESPSLPSTPTKRRCSQFIGNPGQASPAFGKDALEDSYQTWTARERIKTTSCVSLSFDGSLLAVGESGYNPRVLVYSTDNSASTDTPLSILSDHSFGVQSVAFSKDTQYLASLGELNDGFIFVWQISQNTGKARLHSSNKCTTNICDMTWCGRYLITVGTRHAKVWQIASRETPLSPRKPRLHSATEQTASPGPSPLQGRNCLLGDLANRTFTSVIAVDSQTAYVGTDKGHLCKVNLEHAAHELRILEKFAGAITSLSINEEAQELILGTSNGIKKWQLNSSHTSIRDDHSPVVPTNRLMEPASLKGDQVGRGAVAIRAVAEHIVVFDSAGDLLLCGQSAENSTAHTKGLTHHNEALGGIANLPSNTPYGDFLTWTASGRTRFWSKAGKLLREGVIQLADPPCNDVDDVNELKALTVAMSYDCLYTGDKYGVVKVINIKDWREKYACRAHGAEITSIVASTLEPFVATCSRDRTVQLFQANAEGLNLVQTMNEHISAVTDLVFCPTGDRLLSCSSDRTIVVRSRVVSDGVRHSSYYTERVITVRATPLSMAFNMAQSATILLSTMDRSILTIDIGTGVVTDSFKVNDPGNDDTVPLNKIQLLPGLQATETQSSLLVGYSVVDKSIRLYDYEKGLLLGRASGHTEGISDLVILSDLAAPENPSSLTTFATVGLDGTIFLWSVCVPSQASTSVSSELIQDMQGVGSLREQMPAKVSQTSLPPLRKVLSKVDLNGVLGRGREKSPLRELSPPRLLRKSSRLAMTMTISEAEENSHRALDDTKDDEPADSRGSLRVDQRSPSPFSDSDQLLNSSKLGNSRGQNTGRAPITRLALSPAICYSAPTTPQHRKHSHGGRLKRQSINGLGPKRSRKSGTAESIDSSIHCDPIPTTAKQACYVLQSLRNQALADTNFQDLQLLEIELEATLAMVKTRREAGGHKWQSQQAHQVEEIGNLMHNISLNDPSTYHKKVEMAS